MATTTEAPSPTNTWDSRATIRDPADDEALLEGVGDAAADAPKGLELRGTLGEGGMGVVHLAVQRSLQREVAVKTVRAAVASPVASHRLLQEAWVTGSLEHPNIVPVYDLGHDDEGQPRLVLKRIEGALWSELLRDPFAVRERFGVGDPLEWHLRTLAQLCNAVAFAHDRGVIHRDLKPENVMVGAYGEVYLLDWGLALPLDERGEAHPSRRSPQSFSGSPAYLAPEQLGSSERALGPHTDVYLLGAMLFEILHGHPPHLGSSLAEVLRAVGHDAPVIDEALPTALRRLLRRCLSPDPAARPASAEALRQELVRYLELRHAEQLAAKAARQLDELEELVGQPSADEARLRDLLGACRFGFDQALEVDPDHVEARDGRARALTAVARRALAAGDLGAAGLLVDELGTDAPADLSDALSKARQQAARTAARQARVARHHDATIDVRQRVLWLVVIGLIWTLTPVVSFWPLGVAPTWFGALIAGGLFGAMALAVVLGLSRGAESTQANRVLKGVVSVAPPSYALAMMMGWQLQLDPGEALAIALCSWSVMSMLGMVWYGVAIVGIPLTYAVAASLSAAYPTWAPVTWGVANLGFAITMVVYRLPTLRAAARRR